MFPSYSKFDIDLEFDLQTPEWGVDPAAPSEDFWKKFEELPDLGDDLETLLGMNLDEHGISGHTIEDEPEIELDLSGVLTRNDDPLWAGTTTVISKQPPSPPPKPNPTPPSLLYRGPVDRRPKKINVVVSRKPAAGAQGAAAGAGTALKQSAQQLLSVVPRPETPLSPSDSEQEEEKVDVEKLRGVVRLGGNGQQIRRMYPNGTSIGVDSPKRKSIQSGRSSKVVPQYTVAPHMDDHNYEFDKSSSGKTSVKPEDLGVVTPSDSEEDQRSSASEEEDEEEEEEENEEEDEEEEIDVVSLSRDSLPTNPTLEIRRQLQNKVASAITTNTLLSASRAVSKRLNQKRCKRKRTNSDDEDCDEKEIIVKIEPQDDEDPLCLRGVSTATTTSYGGRSESLPTTPQHSNHYFNYHRSRGTSSASSTPRANSSSAASSTSTTPRRYAKPHKKSRFSDSEPSTEKRHMHNNMERMRRIDLRNAFEDLRELIPNLMGVQRAAKVSILKDATSYLYELRQKEKTLHQQVSALRGHQDKLRTTLSQLRRSLAAKR